MRLIFGQHNMWEVGFFPGIPFQTLERLWANGHVEIRISLTDKGIEDLGKEELTRAMLEDFDEQGGGS